MRFHWPFRRISLTVSIFTILSIAVLSVGSTLALYNYVEGKAAARDIASALIDQIASEVEGEAEHLVAEAVELVTVVSASSDVARPISVGVHPIGWMLLRALDETDGLSSVFVGRDDGSFFQIFGVSPSPNDPIRRRFDLPAAAVFAYRAIVSNGGAPRERWRFLDARHSTVSRRDVPYSGYDPRRRPWFKQAKDHDAAILTRLYLFASTGLPGVTAARAFAGGVIGADIRLQSLNEFLDEHGLTPRSRLAVINDEGAVLAAPHLKDVLSRKAGPSGLGEAASISDMKDPILSRAAARPVGAGAFKYDGERILYRVREVKVARGVRLYSIYAAPEADFTVSLATLRDRSLLFTLALMVLGLPVAYMAARRMSKALESLAIQALRIRRFSFDDGPRVRSFVREVDILAAAFDRMSESIKAFGVYVPKTLVARILESKETVAIGGRRENISVMFTDVVGFTSITEKLSPEALMTQTSMLFDEISFHIAAHDGVVDKFIGDSVMALWNAPNRAPGHPARACAAALAIQSGCRSVGRKLAESGAPVMALRIGLHCGEAVVGNVGARERMNYTAVGDVVNIASRLEGLAKRYGVDILISGDVAGRAGETFVTRLLDWTTPRGSSRRIEIHELVGLRESLGAGGGFYDAWNQAQRELRRGNRDVARAMFKRLALDRPDDLRVQRMVDRGLG